MGFFPTKNLESTAPKERARGGDDHLRKSEAPMALKLKGERRLKSLGHGKGMGGRELGQGLSTVELSERVGGERDLNVVGPKENG